MSELIWDEIEAIIFDLGGVLLNIDYSLSQKAMSDLLGCSVNFSKKLQADLFSDYESGQISDQQFRDGLRSLSLSQKEFSDDEIDHAWNIMLGDLPQRRVAMLEEVGATKRIYLLSNTNGIHYRAFCADIEKNMKIQRFEALFQKLYWSHELGMRKPNQDIFQHVLSDNGLDPASTLFIDDSPQHVEGARKLGIKAFHLTGEICDQVEMWISQSKLKQ